MALKPARNASTCKGAVASGLGMQAQLGMESMSRNQKSYQAIEPECLPVPPLCPAACPAAAMPAWRPVPVSSLLLPGWHPPQHLCTRADSQQLR